jgi:superfamily II DNA or RNA helicase
METNRGWQTECLGALLNGVRGGKRDWLVTATPGAGKTRFGFLAGRALIEAGVVDYMHAVASTRLIRRGWEQAGASSGLPLVRRPNGSLPEFGGIATTYAQVAASPSAHAAAVHKRRALVILDEIHHAGDKLTWGDGIERAFGDAAIRLELSGTAWREDGARIPFVTYGADGVCKTDYPYTYDRALRDGICRPVSFVTVKQGITFRGDATDEQRSRVLKTSIDPVKGIIHDLVVAADEELTRKRSKWPDAGAMLLTRDQDDARACADIIESVCGERPGVVISDNSSAEEDLRTFQNGRSRWLVSVRMVSEGVDIPRLMVGAYATNITTPLFFRQFVGRFVRIREKSETATIFLPNDGRLIAEAATVETDVQRVANGAGTVAKIRLPGNRETAPAVPNYQFKVSYRPPIRARAR